MSEETTAPVTGEETANQSSEDLLAQLTQQSETKTPKDTAASSWSFSEEEIAATETNDPAPGAKTEPEKPATKITAAAKQASARVAVGVIDMLQKSIFTPIVNVRYKKKFSTDELEKLTSREKELIDGDKAKLQDDDLALRNKYDRIMLKRDKKIAGIPLNKTEESDLQEAFAIYFDVKQKSLPPEWLLYASLAKVLVNRSIDAFTD